MKGLYQYNKTKLIISIIIFFLAILFLAPLISNSTREVTGTDLTPDTSFGYGLKELKGMKDIYALEGAKRYFLTRFTYDLLWSAIYLFFIINAIAFLVKDVDCRSIKSIKTLPFIVVLFDIFENSFCSLYFFNGKDSIGVIASYSSKIKWYLLILILVLCILLGVYKTYRYAKRVT